MISFVPARILIIRGGNLKLSHRTRSAAVALLLTAAAASGTVAHAADEIPPEEMKALAKAYAKTVGDHFCDNFKLTHAQVEAYTDAYDNNNPLVDGKEAELRARGVISLQAVGIKGKSESSSMPPLYGDDVKKAFDKESGSGWTNAFRRLICDNAEARSNYSAARKTYNEQAGKLKPGLEEEAKLDELNYKNGKKMFSVLCEAGVTLDPVEGQLCGDNKKSATDDDKD
ncbi:hypothetical protein ACIA8C_22180 [Nocardia sp. NPDC051321]|uniref:hypothetical protein n=1 Tax=Nocardia sp. NPDC051321 TaxID=3364323 RepID=UPI0037AD3D8C